MKRTFSEAQIPAESEERNHQANLPAVQGESKGRKETAFEERNQTLCESNRVYLRGG